MGLSGRSVHSFIIPSIVVLGLKSNLSHSFLNCSHSEPDILMVTALLSCFSAQHLSHTHNGDFINVLFSVIKCCLIIGHRSIIKQHLITEVYMFYSFQPYAELVCCPDCLDSPFLQPVDYLSGVYTLRCSAGCGYTLYFAVRDFRMQVGHPCDVELLDFIQQCERFFSAVGV